MRAGLDWAISPGGDGSIGVALSVAAGPLWMRLSLVEECRSRATQALCAPEFGCRFQKVVVIKRGDLDAGLRLLRAGPDEIAASDIRLRSLTGLTELAEALARAGRAADGLALVEAGIEQSEGGWVMPELLRLEGEIFLLQGTAACAERSEALFREALNEARRQETLSWELRAATSLARQLSNRGRPADALACLQPVYDRFSEGFGTADLVAAKRLLDVLGGAGRR